VPLPQGLHSYYKAPDRSHANFEKVGQPSNRGIMSIFQNDKTFSRPVIWGVTTFFIALHILAFTAFFFFSWKALILAVIVYWIAGSLGIGMGYHRLLTHRGFKAPKWVEYFLTTCGTLAIEGGPIAWVATHRVHHQNTDKEGDPHSPNDGGFFAHMGWIITGKAMHARAEELLPFVPDLRKDKYYVWISKYHWVPPVVLAVIIYAAFGWSCLLWAVFLRTVAGLHSTWFVNSATHMWGSQRFLTGDSSTNSFWVAMLTFGEGWHNNHHASPQAARHGIAWYEIDMNWYGIRALKALGLAWDIKLPKAKLSAAELATPHAVVPQPEELTAAISGD
jgi:fatty-acid desaturase